jgi:uncharacterized membrane protein HdeD (DUF308 family)
METKGYKNWGLLAINGLIAILFGCLMLFSTGETINIVVRYFGLVLVVSGVVLAFIAYRNIKNDKGSVLLLLEAVATLAIGVMLMVSPENSLNFFLVLTGIWAVLIGIAQLVVLINVGSLFTSRNILLVNALLTAAIGVLLIFHPFAVATLVCKLVGIAAILFGTLMIYLALLLRSVRKPPAGVKP